MSPIEPFQTLLQEALSPEADRGLTAVQLLGQRAVGNSIGKKQNQTRALSVGGTQATSPRPSDQLLPLFIGQDDLLRRGVHPHSLRSRNGRYGPLVARKTEGTACRGARQR